MVIGFVIGIPSMGGLGDTTPPLPSYFLLESGDKFLLESGDKWLLE